MPEICCNGGTKHAGGIHRRTGKSSAEQDVERDGRSNHEAGDATRPALVHRGAMDYEHEKESEDAFDQNSLPGRQVDGQLRGPTNHCVPPKQTETNQSR